MCVCVSVCENKGIYWLLNDLCTLCNVIIDNFVPINSVQLYHIPGALTFFVTPPPPILYLPHVQAHTQGDKVIGSIVVHTKFTRFRDIESGH